MRKYSPMAKILDVRLADPGDLNRIVRIEFGERRRNLSAIMRRGKEERRATLAVTLKFQDAPDPQRLDTAILRNVEEETARSFAAAIKRRLENTGCSLTENYRNSLVTGKVIMFTVTRPYTEDDSGIVIENMPPNESITPVIC